MDLKERGGKLTKKKKKKKKETKKQGRIKQTKNGQKNTNMK